jgi:hypothetical protein
VCDITFNGSGFNADNGLVLHAGLVVQGSTKGFIWQSSAAIMNGSFSLQGMDVLQKGVSYFLNYYVDINKNGTCEATPTDDVFRLSMPNVQDNVIVTVTPNMTLSNLGCGGF